MPYVGLQILQWGNLQSVGLTFSNYPQIFGIHMIDIVDRINIRRLHLHHIYQNYGMRPEK